MVGLINKFSQSYFARALVPSSAVRREAGGIEESVATGETANEMDDDERQLTCTNVVTPGRPRTFLFNKFNFPYCRRVVATTTVTRVVG